MGCQCAKQTENKNNEITSEKDIFQQSNDNNLTSLKTKKPEIIPSEDFNSKMQNNYNSNIEPPIEFTNQIEKKENENEYLNNNENINQNIINSNPQIENMKNENYNQENIKNKELKPEDNFSLYIFEHINLLRENPKSFINLIEDSKKKITYDKKRLVYKSNVKVALSKGEPAFDGAISVLKNTVPMNKLIYNPNMNIPLPISEEEIKDKNYLKNNVKLLLSNNVKIRTYWRDIINDPETSFILMIVDDSGNKAGNKRKDLLNPDMKYIGICSTMIGKNFVCYLCFSE